MRQVEVYEHTRIRLCTHPQLAWSLFFPQRPSLSVPANVFRNAGRAEHRRGTARYHSPNH